MILQLFAKIIDAGTIIEHKIARAARKLSEDEGEQPKTQVTIAEGSNFSGARPSSEKTDALRI
ncbi:MAG: hypothetical protein ACKVOH_03210 [Chlamydiales bacterium]